MQENTVKTIWGGFGMAVLAIAILILVAFLLAPKRLQGYYAGGDLNNGMATCVHADWSWAPDTKAYCTNNPQQAIEDIKQLNSTIR